MSHHYCGLIRRGLAVLSALPAQATPVAGDDAVRSQEALPKEALLYVPGGGALECALACALEQCTAWARGHATAVGACGTTRTADVARGASSGARGTGGAASCEAQPAGDDGGTAFDFAALVGQLMCAVPRYKPPSPPPPASHVPTDTAPACASDPRGPHGPAGSQAAGAELPLLPTAMRAEVRRGGLQSIYRLRSLWPCRTRPLLIIRHGHTGRHVCRLGPRAGVLWHAPRYEHPLTPSSHAGMRAAGAGLRPACLLAGCTGAGHAAGAARHGERRAAAGGGGRLAVPIRPCSLSLGRPRAAPHRARAGGASCNAVM